MLENNNNNNDYGEDENEDSIFGVKIVKKKRKVAQVPTFTKPANKDLKEEEKETKISSSKIKNFAFEKVK